MRTAPAGLKPNYYPLHPVSRTSNYQLASRGQNCYFSRMVQFLNFFDSSIKFELSFVNMATDSTSSLKRAFAFPS